MADVHGVPVWPGVVAPASFSYTLSHGITPGVALLTTLPQQNPPAMFGNLVITDGVHGPITLPDCKVSKITQSRSGEGTIWHLEILDRRWRWAFGRISGSYNQVDEHSKLIPLTVRSPEELAILCLQAMQETTWSIDLPGGLTRQDGIDFVQRAGLDSDEGGLTQVVGTNYMVNWEDDSPAVCLAGLCEQMGRVVIYQWTTNRVLIARQGVGAQLPTDGSIAMDSPAVDLPEKPTGVQVVGAPTLFQAELVLEPVALEWNERWRELGVVSYRPLGSESQQVVDLTIENPQSGENFWIYLLADENTDAIDGNPFIFPAHGETAAQVAAALKTMIEANAAVASVLTVTRNGKTLRLTGIEPGVSFQVLGKVEPEGFGGAINMRVLQRPDTEDGTWTDADTPHFSGVKATDRLSLVQSMQLAQQSVFRAYRIKNTMLDGSPLQIPGYGRIERRQQIILTEYMVEQIIPDEADTTVRDAREQFLIVNLYNGFHRSRPAAVYGSICDGILKSLGRNKIDEDSLRPNSLRLRSSVEEGDQELAQVHVPFKVDPENQLIIFSRPVYRIHTPLGIRAATNLILRCAVMIRDADTHALVRYSRKLSFTGQEQGYFAVRKFNDVQENIIGEYNPSTGAIIGSQSLDGDASQRSEYYANAMAIQYLVENATIREYNGIRPLDLDGAISQITWDIMDGCKTTASRNTEHSLYVAPYPVRRRNEYLAAGTRAAPAAASLPASQNQTEWTFSHMAKATTSRVFMD